MQNVTYYYTARCINNNIINIFVLITCIKETAGRKYNMFEIKSLNSLI